MVIALKDLLKHYYGLEPSQSQVSITFVKLPWSLKFFCGIISDSFPILGSRKKSWLVICGTIQIIASLMAATINFESHKWIIFLCTITSAAGCFGDVIVDALMVI